MIWWDETTLKIIFARFDGDDGGCVSAEFPASARLIASAIHAVGEFATWMRT
jgi:hypothetical protein